MADRVEVGKHQEDDRWIREETGTVVKLDDDDSTSQEEQEDHEGTADEREI